MKPETKKLILEMRSKIPVSIMLCQQTLADTNNNLEQAIVKARHIIICELATRLEINIETAEQYLNGASFDSELAACRWKSDNPTPPSSRDIMLSGGELAIQLPNRSPKFVTYLHIIPKNNRQFDLRIITHNSKYTEEHYALDYDYAVLDSTTHIEHFNPLDFQTVCNHLDLLAININDLKPPTEFDSCLLNSPIDIYL